MTDATQPTLFQKLGGYRSIEMIVANFYQFALADERINQYYIDNVSDVARLHTTLTQFLSFVLGGPNLYKGRDLIQIHKNMPITAQDYEYNWEHF